MNSILSILKIRINFIIALIVFLFSLSFLSYSDNQEMSSNIQTTNEYYLWVPFLSANENFLGHPDEPVVIATAINISKGSLNPNFFRYPSGQTYILASLFYFNELFHGEMKKEDYLNIARLFSRICVSGIITIVFLICTININFTAGLFSSIFSISSLFLRTHSSYTIQWSATDSTFDYWEENDAGDFERYNYSINANNLILSKGSEHHCHTELKEKIYTK